MRVLAINCGSSTLKFQLVESDSRTRLAEGVIERIGDDAAADLRAQGGKTRRQPVSAADHGEATRRMLAWLDESGLGDRVEAAGHRVVHGGERFREPALIDDEAVAAIESLEELAPLHNAPALAAIRAAREALGPGVPMVATFDTAFHRTMPPHASAYAIDPALAARHGVRRFGFHGLAHRYMTERYAEIAAAPIGETKLVTLQLGNGCSAAAVAGGRSLETSMGFTPLEGLVMGTRSGDVDPSLAGYLARREGVPTEEVEGWLNTKSGLLGVSGRSRDMRELLEAESRGDERAALAVEMFCHRVRKYIGAYLAVLAGAEAVVFGGGIGENSPEVRARVCGGMDWCGLELDPQRNAEAAGAEGRISVEGAGLRAYVIPVDEGAIIVQDTESCLQQRGRG